MAVDDPVVMPLPLAGTGRSGPCLPPLPPEVTLPPEVDRREAREVPPRVRTEVLGPLGPLVPTRTVGIAGLEEERTGVVIYVVFCSGTGVAPPLSAVGAFLGPLEGTLALGGALE